ncbi:beta-propeller domain-containing protein [Haloarchaeobius salinus]|uniref:beta-propeller domain-containing protein n=1 Tax=Haloarchaeobius salinus TaxID=1198298 RepID=UPI00210BF147|nr:beta-propeller domain-containing protein [Haloarchaeobius salinus]
MRRSLQVVVLLAAIATVAVGVGAFALMTDSPGDATDPPTTDPPTVDGEATVEQFGSDAAFEEYVRAAQRDSGGTFLAGGGGGRVTFQAGDDVEVETADAATNSQRAGGSDGGGSDARISDTNVQVGGVDEPDRLKTGQDTLYYADGRYWGGGYVRDDGYGRTRFIDASDPAAPEIVGGIPDSGQLLLVNDTLVVLSNERVTGYDISDRENPEQVWEVGLNSHIQTARMTEGRLVLVLQQGVSLDDPCPVEPFTDRPGTACGDVYHPGADADASVTYTVVSMDPHTGDEHDRVTFLGTRQHSATYVTNDSVYLTYTQRVPYAETYQAYLQSSAMLDETAHDRLDELATYDLTRSARMTELHALVQDWLARQPADERDQLRSDLQSGYEEYVDERKRDLLRSGIVRIDREGDSLSVAETGAVPGRPLNQWALDEHEGTLRIATTVDPHGATSVNDVYTLDGSLDVQGSARDMGETEQIYSVRFEGDTAYVVTFREIDPFYTLDLSDPENPEIQGELKLPGFSRYLHPLSEDRILGIGQEDGQVKATVFDVSDPQDPTVAESRILEARWSAIAQTHHAFLYDQRHEVFFLPTERGGYVFDTELNQQAFVRTDSPATRAAYVGDYLYVFSNDGLTVVDEETWEPVSELPFDRVDSGEPTEPVEEPAGPEPRPADPGEPVRPVEPVDAEWPAGTPGADATR